VATLFDTTILIDTLNGIEAGVAELTATDDRFVSIITTIEVLAGAPTRHTESLARELLSSMTLLPLSEDVAEAAVSIRRATRLKLPDAIILATARVHGLTLSTRNTRDFPEGDPNVRVPYRL